MSDNEQNPADKIADTAGKVLDSVRHAIEEGIEAIRPTWEEKVAPVVASGAEKVAEWGDTARDSADRKAAELNSEDRPSSKILGGALGVAAAGVALGTGAARAIGKAAAESATAEPTTTESSDPVAAPVDNLITDAAPADPVAPAEPVAPAAPSPDPTGDAPGTDSSGAW